MMSDELFDLHSADAENAPTEFSNELWLAISRTLIHSPERAEDVDRAIALFGDELAEYAGVIMRQQIESDNINVNTLREKLCSFISMKLQRQPVH